MVPLYRLWSAIGTDHFYTTSAGDRDGAVAGTYTYEGIIGYIFPTEECGATAFYRLYHPGVIDHFYTASQVEADNAANAGAYNREGITGYVLP